MILDTAPTGDALLDAALASMTVRKRPPTAKAWVARNRPGLAERHLDRLATAGTVAARRSKALGFIPVTRWAVTDPPRQAQAAVQTATDAAHHAAHSAGGGHHGGAAGGHHGW